MDRSIAAKRCARVAEAISRLVPPGVAVSVHSTASGDPAAAGCRPDSVLAATARRRALHEAGRRSAATVVAHLGSDASPGVAAADGAPTWPVGVVGSISHSGDIAAAVAGRSTDVRGLGIDLEARLRLPSSRAPLFSDERELAWLSAQPVSARPRLVLILFCAKESVQKCLRATCGRVPAADATHISLDPRARRFEAVYVGPAPPTAGFVLQGRFTQRSGYTVAVAWTAS
ncbi:MAG: 4'-phosphopantetheinyl transferase family protein [Hyphomicrobiales bacterium]